MSAQTEQPSQSTPVLANAPSPTPPTTTPPTSQPPSQSYIYQLIYKQLIDDGLTDIATILATKKQINPNVEIPANSLAAVIETANRTNLSQTSMIDDNNNINDNNVDPASLYRRSFPPYVSPFVSNFRSSVTCSAFHSSSDFTFLACGSEDRTVKIIDVSLIDGKARVDHDACIKATLYDHADAVTDLSFHSYEPFLATAAKDFTIRFYDISSLTQSSTITTTQSSSSYRRPVHVLVDHLPIKTIHFHPSGDYLLSGTDSPIIRLYDTITMQSYYNDNSSSSHHYHTRGINSLRYNNHGSLFVSTSSDGSMILFDTVTMKPINIFSQCHSGAEVTNALFHTDNFTVLSSGHDNKIIEWETRMNRQLHSYIGANHSHRSIPVCYDSSGEFIISGDEISGMIHIWDRHSNNSQAVKKLSGHTKSPRTFCSLYSMDEELITSGEGGVFCSGGDDGRVRVWSILNDREEQ